MTIDFLDYFIRVAALRNKNIGSKIITQIVRDFQLTACHLNIVNVDPEFGSIGRLLWLDEILEMNVVCFTLGIDKTYLSHLVLDSH